MVLHCQVLFSLAIAAIVEAILMWTSAEQVPSLQRVAPRYLKLVTSKFWMHMLISALMFIWLVTILLFSCADFHSIICFCSVYKSVGEVLKFTIAATHKINVTGKSYFAYAPSTIGDRCVVVMECLLRDLLWEQVEQDG